MQLWAFSKEEITIKTHGLSVDAVTNADCHIWTPIIYIVTYMTIARQKFGKHVPKVTQSTVERPPLLGNKQVGTFRSNGWNK
jgi:hypothetical protein